MRVKAISILILIMSFCMASVAQMDMKGMDMKMHKAGKCPKCGMTLVKQKMTDEQMKMMKEGTYIKPKE